MKYIFICLVLGCGIMILPGCSKKSGPVSQACRLVSASANNQGLITNYSFSYDGKGRLISVQTSGNSGSAYKETLTYGDKYIATSTDFSGTPGSFDTVNLDGSGNVASIIITGQGSRSTITYARDGQGNPTQSVSVSGNGTTTTTTYQYTNGDLVSGSTMGNAFSYGYAGDKPAAVNDAMALQQYLNYGVIAYRSAHLCQSFQSGGIHQTYAYTMDDKGNITDMTTTDVNTSKAVGTVHFVYDCN